MTVRRSDGDAGETRSRLKTALMELLDRKDYDAVTVREIAERAGVGRSTFYTHFGSKEELLFDGFGDWLVALAVDHPEGFSLPLLRHVRSQQRFFRSVILGNASSRVRGKVTELLAGVVERQIAGRDAVRERPPDRGSSWRFESVARQVTAARAHALAGAFLELVAWWLEDGRHWTPEDVDGVYREMCLAAEAYGGAT